MATTRSSLPSPSISAAAMERGRLPPASKVCGKTWKVPLPLPRNTVTLLEEVLVTARSSAPSPLKWPTATA